MEYDQLINRVYRGQRYGCKLPVAVFSLNKTESTGTQYIFFNQDTTCNMCRMLGRSHIEYGK